MATKRSHSTAFECHQELLGSGKFSDVTVKCGNRKWKLHRVILAARSPFFRNALEPGKFKESLDNQVEIREQDSDKVNWVIHFIYTAKVPHDLRILLESQRTGINACIDLFTVADFFMVDSLCKHAVEVLTELIIQQANFYQQHVGSNFLIHSGTFPASNGLFCTNFFKAVRRVYGVTSDSFQLLKNALLLYPQLTFYLVLLKGVFREQLYADPKHAEFVVDILKTRYPDAAITGDPTFKRQCQECHARDVFVWNRFIPFGKSRFLCRKCQPLGEEHVMELLGAVKP